jgi:lysophospholipase L1-like esterase
VKRRLLILSATIFSAATALAQSQPAAAPGKKPDEPKKPSAGDLGALFRMHWETRVRSFKEQNLAWRNVVLLGDSITEGFDVVKYFPGRRVLNRGVGADVIGNDMAPKDPRGVLQRLDNSVFDCAATDVFILIGINDLNSGRTVETMEAGYRELLGRLRKGAPALRIHVQSVLPTRGAFDARNEPVRQFNARLRKLAEEFGCAWIDLHPLMCDAEGKLKAGFTNDGLHLTEVAYAIWREQILSAMNWQ